MVDASHLTDDMQAGITAYAAPLNHYDVVLCRRDGKLIARANLRLGQLAHTQGEVELSSYKAYLRITSDRDYYYLQVSADGRTYQTLAQMDFRYLSTEVIGGFTGVMLGAFAQTTDNSDSGYVDFDWFEYKINDSKTE